MIRFLADSIRQVDIVPEPAFFSGLADTLGERGSREQLGARSMSGPSAPR